MRNYDLYWMTNPDWYDYADDGYGEPFLAENAPKEAKESFNRYLEQKNNLIIKHPDARRRGEGIEKEDNA